VKLAAIPAPPPVIVQVPTYISLPPEATAKCVEPQSRPVLTDLDLYIVAAEWRKAAKCANGKLTAIEGAQP
jgi:hypothetical protein